MLTGSVTRTFYPPLLRSASFKKLMVGYEMLDEVHAIGAIGLPSKQ
jgi:galactose-1-phosphate uridylyltransferase